MTQGTLDFTPAPQILPPVVDPQVPKRDARRLGGMALRILERLRERPVTNPEFASLFPPGAAWRTRVSDVRKFLEAQGETVATRELSPGLWEYRIERVER